jgi:hypothetical protein
LRGQGYDPGVPELRERGEAWLRNAGYEGPLDRAAVPVGVLLSDGRYSAAHLHEHARVNGLRLPEKPKAEPVPEPVVVDAEPLPTRRMSGEKRSKVLKLRLAPSEFEMWEQDAREQGKPLAELVRRDYHERVAYRRAVAML